MNSYSQWKSSSEAQWRYCHMGKPILFIILSNDTQDRKVETKKLHCCSQGTIGWADITVTFFVKEVLECQTHALHHLCQEKCVDTVIQDWNHTRLEPKLDLNSDGENVWSTNCDLGSQRFQTIHQMLRPISCATQETAHQDCLMQSFIP